MTTCAKFVQAWLAQFREVNDRATILVLWGPSRSGKTRFALSDIFGSNPLKVDVGDSEDLNIQAWDHRVHSHLVLDNVNSSAYIMRWRHVLMGPPEAVQLGQSGTGMYVYDVFLGRKPVICSMDEDAVWEEKKWKKVEVECTGLGGHDLGGPIPWHLCIRTDKFKQGIYGPSIACLEGSLSGGQQQAKCEVALGLTKAMHEFLILHYFATDSADS